MTDHIKENVQVTDCGNVDENDALQPCRNDAKSDGRLSGYAHMYDIAGLENGKVDRTADGWKVYGTSQSSTTTTTTDNDFYYTVDTTSAQVATGKSTDIPTSQGVVAYTQATYEPKFSILPVSKGGTGASSRTSMSGLLSDDTRFFSNTQNISVEGPINGFFTMLNLYNYIVSKLKADNYINSDATPIDLEVVDTIS